MIIQFFRMPKSILLPMCLPGSTQGYQIAVMIINCTNGAHFLWIKCAYARFESANLKKRSLLLQEARPLPLLEKNQLLGLTVALLLNEDTVKCLTAFLQAMEESRKL